MAHISRYFDYKLDENGAGYLEVALKGMALLRMNATNKGTAFSLEERRALGLEGLLPPKVLTLQQQADRVYRSFLTKPDDISKYQMLRATQERNEVVFYRVLADHLEEMMPIVYTPTVGKAVQEYSSLYKSARGMTFCPGTIDRADELLSNYPWQDVRMIVATDSSAILGIGDQGHGGLAISIGKLALYTAGAGVSPFHTMPVHLDVGTDREDLLADPEYLGYPAKRITGDEYMDFVEKFVDAVETRWPKAVIQWEDFAKDIAYKVLDRYKDRIPCFNDDIQGTGATVLAGLLTACKSRNLSISDQKIVVVGAGAGGVGVARAIQAGLVHAGLSVEQARRQMFVMDIDGLVVEGHTDEEYKFQTCQFEETYADWDIKGERPDLEEVVRFARPTVLLGLTGCTGLFGEELVRAMAENCEHPMIFPLSNPTTRCEATPEDLYQWTDGRAVVSTGSPFAPVEWGGKKHLIGQGNNAFVFPGIGFASILGKCRRISDAMILESAFALADYTEEYYLQQELIFPPVSALRDVSLYVTARVLKKALEDGSADRPDLEGMSVEELEAYATSRAWEPKYLPFVPKAD